MTPRFRFIFEPNLDGDADTEPFISDPVLKLDTAKYQLEAVANYTLHLHDMHLMSDFSNYGLIQQEVEGGKWETMDEDDE